MHRKFRELLSEATGTSQHIITLNLDIRGFTPFCQSVDSLDVATYIKKVYMKILDDYFKDVDYYKPTGDGLLLVFVYDEASLREKINIIIDSCIKLVNSFGELCSDDPMINYPTPNYVGIGVARGSACCISSEDNILDYSGRVLNLASRLMNVARPLGIVFDEGLDINLLEEEIRDQFNEDEIYLRGIAEKEKIKIYYSNTHVIVSDSFKRSIKEPTWESVTRGCSYQEFKKLDENIIIELYGRALNEESISVVISHQRIQNGVVSDTFETIYSAQTREAFEYSEVGRKGYVTINFEELCKEMEDEDISDDMTILMEVTYIKK